MKKLFIFSLLGLASVMLNAQAPIVLQSGDQVFLHTRLDTIVKHAQSGDDIYLPGGNVVLSSELRIDREVHIYGAGHYPDSSKATSVTFVTGGSIRFIPGSSKSTLTGIYMYNDIYFGLNQTDVIQYVDVSRCNLASVCLGYTTGQRNSGNSYLRFSENVIRGGILEADAQNCLFEKNIIDGSISYITGNVTFSNNIFNYYSYSYSVFNSCTGVIVKDNIFTRDSHGLASSQIDNNLFVVSQTDSPGGTNIGSGNIGSQSLESIFLNFDGGGFGYTYDYHLKEGCAGIGAATDGYDIGIYGTENPYKPSAVPVNPHIRFVKVARESVNGLLPVEVDVSAQTH
ncbi:hypothetical protein ACE01N_01165 [Saccharicrinis sp. FJH2]|uniref:hypothetical protein n=1 Tax=Saccharicrinis sp. FJH65 TaxID=3344659 RepID=UPI0035F2E4F6